MTDLNELSLERLYAVLDAESGGRIGRLLELARDEDLGGADGVEGIDRTSALFSSSDRAVSAVIESRSEGVVAGLSVIPDIVRVFDPSASVVYEGRAKDGDTIRRGQALGALHGPAPTVLTIERTLLNLVGRLSGVATLTAKYVAAAAGTRAKILDTRKTTPGLRVLEKYAVRCGGGFCHRLGLYDAVLIKDNHIESMRHLELSKLLSQAISDAKESLRPGLRFVEVEVDRLDQLEAILAAGGCGLSPVNFASLQGFILLDNMTTDQLRRAVEMRDRSGLKIELEASGGVRLETIREIALTGVDRISVGALTHQAVSLDIGLDVVA